MDESILQKLQKSGISRSDILHFFSENFDKPTFSEDLMNLFGYEYLDEIGLVVQYFDDLLKKKQAKSVKHKESKNCRGNKYHLIKDNIRQIRTGILEFSTSSQNKKFDIVSLLDKLYLGQDTTEIQKILKKPPDEIAKHIYSYECNYKMCVTNSCYVFGDAKKNKPKTTTINATNTTHIHMDAVKGKVSHPLMKTSIITDFVFPYEHFNTIQSICLSTAYFSNKNMLLSAPTGCGKTEIALMAISRALKNLGKVIYLVPMKALATEVTSKLQERFKNVTTLEFTGDTDYMNFEINKAKILVATPEKFDVYTRKINASIQVSLLIIDEIHILNESRGCVIEALVCRVLRMIEIQQFSTRIVGLSATIPNFEDIGRFILAQRVFHFENEYRPVPLKIELIGIKENETELLDLDFDKEDFLASIKKSKMDLAKLMCDLERSKNVSGLCEADYLESDFVKSANSLRIVEIEEEISSSSEKADEDKITDAGKKATQKPESVQKTCDSNLFEPQSDDSTTSADSCISENSQERKKKAEIAGNINVELAERFRNKFRLHNCTNDLNSTSDIPESKSAQSRISEVQPETNKFSEKDSKSAIFERPSKKDRSKKEILVGLSDKSKSSKKDRLAVENPSVEHSAPCKIFKDASSSDTEISSNKKDNKPITIRFFESLSDSESNKSQNESDSRADYKKPDYNLQKISKVDKNTNFSKKDKFKSFKLKIDTKTSKETDSKCTSSDSEEKSRRRSKKPLFTIPHNEIRSIPTYDGSKQKDKYEKRPTPPHILYRKKTLEIIVQKLKVLFRDNHQCLVFCTSRKDTEKVSKQLFSYFPKKSFDFHHAGLPRENRLKAEKNFRMQKTDCLVTTSTLAWGVNLPARCVIIKDTKFYNKNIGDFTQISILDILQIFGRAGRPQYDTVGEALLICENKMINDYFKMFRFKKNIESGFLKSVIDFLNSEIYLENVKCLEDAYKWVQSTFLFVRMHRNPKLYGIKSDSNRNKDLKKVICQYISLSIKRLVELKMICVDDKTKQRILEDTDFFGKSIKRDSTTLEKAEIPNPVVRKSNVNSQAKKSIPLSANARSIEFRLYGSASRKISQKLIPNDLPVLEKNRTCETKNTIPDNHSSTQTKDTSVFSNRTVVIPLTSVDAGLAFVNWLDPDKLYFKSTPLGRIASHAYLRHETVQNFTDNIDFVFDETSLTTTILKSSEFSDILLREDEQYALRIIAEDLKMDPCRDEIEKMHLLLLCHKHKIPLHHFTLQCDQNFVLENFQRLLGAFIDIIIYLEKFSLLQYANNLEIWYTKKDCKELFSNFCILNDYIFLDSFSLNTQIIQEGRVIGLQTTKYDFIKFDKYKKFTALTQINETEYTEIEKLYKFGVHSCPEASWVLFGHKKSCKHFEIVYLDKNNNLIPTVSTKTSQEPCPVPIDNSNRNKIRALLANKNKINISKVSGVVEDRKWSDACNNLNHVESLSPIFTNDKNLAKGNSLFTTQIQKSSNKRLPIFIRNMYSIKFVQVDSVNYDEKLKIITRKILEIYHKKKLIVTHTNEDMFQTKHDINTLVLLQNIDARVDQASCGKVRNFENEFVTTLELVQMTIKQIPEDCIIIFKTIHGNDLTSIFDILSIIGKRICYIFDSKNIINFYADLFANDDMIASIS